MPAMQKRGVPSDKSWNYGTVGCAEPAPSGISFTSSDAAIFNMALPLDTVLQGKTTARDRALSRARHYQFLEQIDSMAKLQTRLEQTMDRQMDELQEYLTAIEHTNAREHPTPFSSLTVQGCTETATDLSEGGALYNASGVQGVGLADLANSLAALNELVFDSGEYTLYDIAKACQSNFAGQDQMRARMLAAPKYGNDDKTVDDIAAQLVEMYNRIVSKRVNSRGGKWMPGFYSMTCHRAFGRYTAALPSGRLKGASLADGIAPTDGRAALWKPLVFIMQELIDFSAASCG